MVAVAAGPLLHGRRSGGAGAALRPSQPKNQGEAKLYYRRDIDGLRAVAVVPVVLFHAGVRGFSGGFVGVDVFFVISGYLITSLISEEIRQGRFSIVAFYERRVRRIIPALVLVLLVSSALAALLLFPIQFDSFAKSLFATMLFASNMLFWRETGYFAAPASQQPLLHTWSLAVEEQFYVVFPLALVFIHRWLKGGWVAWLAPLAVLSFALSVWGVAHHPYGTFYLAPTRAWELLLGSLLALGAFPRVPSRLFMEVAGAAGLGLIAWGVVTLSTTSPFPGVNALYPCVGAALVIYSGQAASTYAKTLLATGPLVFIGLISYSLYLWHWPLLVFAPLWNIYELTPVQTAAVVALSFVAATLSWRFVEAPFRRRGGVFTRQRVFAAAGAASFALAAFGLFGHFSQGWPARVPSAVAGIEAYSRSVNPRESECMSFPGQKIPLSRACDYGAAVPPSYVVWGDSHADTLVDAIGKVAKKHNAAVKFLVSPSCPPILGVQRTDPLFDCLTDNRDFMDYVLGNDAIKTVILISRYAVYVEGWTDELGPAERGSQPSPYITDAGATVSDHEGRRQLFKAQLQTTVGKLLGAGKRVVLVYPVPEVGYDVPTTLARVAMARRPLDSFTRPFRLYEKRQAFIFQALDGLGQSDGLVRIYPHERLCDATRCIVSADGKPLYRDDDHLSLAGADYVAPLFDSVFEPRTSAAVANRKGPPTSR